MWQRKRGQCSVCAIYEIWLQGVIINNLLDPIKSEQICVIGFNEHDTTNTTIMSTWHTLLIQQDSQYHTVKIIYFVKGDRLSQCVSIIFLLFDIYLAIVWGYILAMGREVHPRLQQPLKSADILSIWQIMAIRHERTQGIVSNLNESNGLNSRIIPCFWSWFRKRTSKRV